MPCCLALNSVVLQVLEIKMVVDIWHFACCLSPQKLDGLSGYYCKCLTMRIPCGGLVGEHMDGDFLMSNICFYTNMAKRSLGIEMHRFLF